jgi:hypothetical protein
MLYIYMRRTDSVDRGGSDIELRTTSKYTKLISSYSSRQVINPYASKHLSQLLYDSIVKNIVKIRSNQLDSNISDCFLREGLAAGIQYFGLFSH